MLFDLADVAPILPDGDAAQPSPDVPRLHCQVGKGLVLVRRTRAGSPEEMQWLARIGGDVIWKCVENTYTSQTNHIGSVPNNSPRMFIANKDSYCLPADASALIYFKRFDTGWSPDHVDKPEFTRLYWFANLEASPNYTALPDPSSPNYDAWLQEYINTLLPCMYGNVSIANLSGRRILPVPLHIDTEKMLWGAQYAIPDDPNFTSFIALSHTLVVGQIDILTGQPAVFCSIADYSITTQQAQRTSDMLVGYWQLDSSSQETCGDGSTATLEQYSAVSKMIAAADIGSYVFACEDRLGVQAQINETVPYKTVKRIPVGAVDLGGGYVPVFLRVEYEETVSTSGGAGSVQGSHHTGCTPDSWDFSYQVTATITAVRTTSWIIEAGGVDQASWSVTETTVRTDDMAFADARSGTGTMTRTQTDSSAIDVFGTAWSAGPTVTDASASAASTTCGWQNDVPYGAIYTPTFSVEAAPRVLFAELASHPPLVPDHVEFDVYYKLGAQAQVRRIYWAPNESHISDPIDVDPATAGNQRYNNAGEGGNITPFDLGVDPAKLYTWDVHSGTFLPGSQTYG